MDTDNAQAAQLYKAAADAGLAAAQYNLAVMIAEGRGVDQHYEAATALFETAAAGGHELAAENLERLQAAIEGGGLDLETQKTRETGGIDDGSGGT